jgi:hypothetical protein
MKQNDILEHRFSNSNERENPELRIGERNNA